MSGKKYRPALFELLGKGTVKPNENGSISTPGWMRGDRKSPFAWFFRKRSEESSASKSAVTIHGLTSVTPVKTSTSVETSAPVSVVAKPAVPAPVTGTPKSTVPAATMMPKPAAVLPEAPRAFGSPEPVKSREPDRLARIPGNRLQLTVSYRVAGVAAFVLLLLMLLVFWMGKSTGGTTGTNPVADAPKSEPVSSSAKLKEIQQTDARKDIFPAPADKPRPADVAKPPAAAIPTNAVASRKGLSLVICSHTNLRELGQVQAYFVRKGIPAEIGQFDNRYVLHSMQTFESITVAKQSNLKETVVELGRRYNTEREKGAAIFQAKTFESAWWINIEKIRQVR